MMTLERWQAAVRLGVLLPALGVAGLAGDARAGDPFYGVYGSPAGRQVTVIRPGGAADAPYAASPDCGAAGGQVSIYRWVAPGTVVELTAPPPPPIPGALPCDPDAEDSASYGDDNGGAGPPGN